MEAINIAIPTGMYSCIGLEQSSIIMIDYTTGNRRRYLTFGSNGDTLIVKKKVKWIGKPYF